MGTKQRDMGFADQITTADGKGRRKWIYALQPQGRLYRLRSALSLGYLLLFFGIPFARIQGMPLLQLNFPEATFVLFGKLFLPQDFLIMGVAMLTFLLFIIVFTLAYGRVFCGWACPQTIFMEMIFRRIEYWIEGSAQQQHLADQRPATTERIVRKAGKHLLFLLVSFLIANTFLAYIIGTEALFRMISEPLRRHTGGFIALAAFTLTFYAIYAFVRELVCTVICPYGRLQGVLMDKNSLSVAYDYRRGEPRGKRKKQPLPDEGDCIDCGLCVQVCPTGIDIRNGNQLECINCTACIDACNRMMLKVQRAPDLVRIASEADLAAGRRSRFNYRRKWYTAVLLLLLTGLTALIAGRSRFDATLLRIPGQILQEHADGTISNLYRIKIVSKSNRTEPYDLRIADPDARIIFAGRHIDSLLPGKASEETFFIKVPAAKVKRRKERYPILILSGDKVIQQKEAVFIGAY